jgi:hypothetical protein
MPAVKAAKIATRANKLLSTTLQVADKLTDVAHVVNSPLGKTIANTVPVVSTGLIAGGQALTGNTAGATQTLMTMGLPMVGSFGGKALKGLSENGGRVLGNLAEMSSNPAASRMMGNMGNLLGNRAVQNTLSATATGVSTLGMYAPTLMQGNQAIQTLQQWQAGAVGPDGKPVGAQDVFKAFMDTGTAATGARMQQRMNANALNNPNANGNPEFGIPTRQDPKLNPGEVQITGYQNGMPVVRHGPDVDPATLKIHQDMAWQTGRDWNPMSRLDGALNPFNAGNPLNPFVNRALGLPTPAGPAAPRFGSRGYEFNMEDVKHRQMTESALTRAQELRQKGDIEGANRLELEAQEFQMRSQAYNQIANDPTQRDLRGDNYIAARRQPTVRPGGHKTGDISTHGRLSPQRNRASGHTNTEADGFVQSHHPIQDEWAKQFAAAIPNSALERRFSHFNKHLIDFILNRLN